MTEVALPRIAMRPCLRRIEEFCRARGFGFLKAALFLRADAFAGLQRWHRWQELFALAHIAVANRPGYDHPSHPDHDGPAQLAPELVRACAGRHSADPSALRLSPAGLVLPFTTTPLAISATLIRALIGHGRSARYLLPDSVGTILRRAISTASRTPAVQPLRT